MGTTVIISPATFDLLFYILVFYFGLDFALSGFLGLKDAKRYLEKPKLIGLWAIKRMGISIQDTKLSNFAYMMFSTKNMILYSLIGGILLVFGSSVMIWDFVL